MIDTINFLNYAGNQIQLVPPMVANELEIMLDKSIEPEVLTPTSEQRDRLRQQILGYMKKLAEDVFRINNPRLNEIERSMDRSQRVSDYMEVYFYGDRPVSFKPGVADMSLFRQLLDNETIDYIYRQRKTDPRGTSLKQIAFNVLNIGYYNRFS
jgi:hypothetical protein